MILYKLFNESVFDFEYTKGRLNILIFITDFETFT
jgi:hypothetical protein